MYLPPGRLLAGRPSPSQLPPATPQLSQSQPSQSQLPLGLAPTGDFDHARERVYRDALDKWDALTPRNAIWLLGGKVWFPEAAQSDFAPGFLAPTAWATSQFCQRLGIPAPYFKRCPPRLQDVQFNHWIQHARADREGARAREEWDEPLTPEEEDDPLVLGRPGGNGPAQVPADGETENGTAERWLLRAKGDALRGVLSARYARLDNDCLLDCLARVLPPGFAVDWFSLTDESLHLRLVDARAPRQVLPGDDLMVGLHVGNSEVGRRAVTVDALVYRLVCQNGLIRLVKGKSLLHRRHLYLSAPRFQEALHGAVLGALDAAAGFLDQLQAATRTPVPDVAAVLEMLGKQEALSRSFLEAVEQSMRCEPASQQETVWGLVNGLTQAAQRLPADDRYQVETLAGRLIESGLPKVTPPRPASPRSARPPAVPIGNGSPAPSGGPVAPVPLPQPSAYGTRLGNGQAAQSESASAQGGSHAN